jgi:hypothetical protein
MPDTQAARQALRCMDCGTPYCHCYCPVHNLIPEWNDLVSDTQWERAYRQLDSTNNFPELTGRLCPAPCEGACTLKLAIAERAWERGWVRLRRRTASQAARVSVVGSGPAGLACAQQLLRAGYWVTVLEKTDRPRGLLRYGIPDFRLEKHILDRRLSQLQAEGVCSAAGYASRAIASGEGDTRWPAMRSCRGSLVARIQRSASRLSNDATHTVTRLIWVAGGCRPEYLSGMKASNTLFTFSKLR